MKLSERWHRELERLRHEGRHRALQLPTGLDFSSNDYLGYSELRYAETSLSRSGTASRLLRGHHPLWEEVEAKLAAWHGAEAALLMTSGYAANEGLLSTVVESGDLVFSDQCNHASIIDGLRLCRAEKIIFRHNDANALEMLMRQRHALRSPHQAWFIVTESLFGMEGDFAPLQELAELAARFDAGLIVDEAHATGCFGPGGSGLVDAAGLRERVLTTMHTGGKALGLAGAYLVGSRLLKELLINRCRHFIFTTALPPEVARWWLDVLEQVSQDETSRARLQERTRLLRAELSTRGIDAAGSAQIVSLVIGSDRAAVEAARQVQEAGYDIRAIRPPTVPDGTARLRISIHANHEPSALVDLADALKQLSCLTRCGEACPLCR